MSDLEAGTDVTGAASISPNDPKRTSLVEQLCDRLGALHREGLTLLLAEQSIPLALGIADYAYVLQTGRIALEGPAAELERDLHVQEIYLGISAAAR
jgi:ABC-type branched-subunit amino acid transport system ATPase component